MTVQFTVAIDPTPAGRPRFTGGRAYISSKDRNYRQTLAIAARAAMQGLPPLTGALSCVIRLYRRLMATARNFGDVDNHAKGILDALSGVCFVDDCQIVSCRIDKIQADTPRVEVEISALED